MDLIPVTKEEIASGVVLVDSERRQRIGVKTAKVVEKVLKKSIRTVGRVAYDESRMVDVSLKYKGWVERLLADAVGKRVKRGETLFTVYSPDVHATLQELVIASSSGRASAERGAAGARRTTPTLADAARRRLELWDVPPGVADRVARDGKPPRAVPVVSPASGFIVEKYVVEGAAIEPGARLFRIANLDTVWIQAELYESELPLAREGTPVTVTLAYLPDKRFEGKVAYVYPYLSAKTRTGQIRVELDNPNVELKPDMYANITLSADLGPRLTVPESAVIYAGPRRLVFVDLGEGRLRPTDVEVGLKVDDVYEVLSGLEAGQVVVTSGNFLVAAESRLKGAEGTW
jgi:Cu(I)/Ag(I) efflux system membrane fusion protein